MAIWTLLPPCGRNQVLLWQVIFFQEGEKAFFKNILKTSTAINKQSFLEKTAHFKTMTSNESIMQCQFLEPQLCFTIGWSDIKHHFPPQSGFPVNSSGLLNSASSLSATGWWRNLIKWSFSKKKTEEKSKEEASSIKNDSDRLWCLTPQLVA